MATITKRMTKSGPSYRIQVKMRDKGSGKLNVYSTIWHPPAGLTPKQVEREVVIYADKYESELKMSLTTPGAEGISPDITLGDYAKWWLERKKNEISASYYVNCQTAMKDIIACIGGYKLRELNPTIIQRFYDQMDKKEKTVTTVTAKPALREVMQETKMGYRKLRYEMDLNSCSLVSALAGKIISLEYAERMAECLGCSVTSIFNVTKKKEPYAYETIHKIKRTLRAILSHAKKQRLINDNYAKKFYAAAGVPLVTVAGKAGHARTSTTTDIYSHFLKSSDKSAAEKLEQLFE